MLTAELLLAYLLQAASLFGIQVDTTQIDPQEAYCLAQNIYYEARSEDIQGQIAVASVTVNRVNDPRFPNTICGVVKQTGISKITNRVACAFTWYCTNDLKEKEIVFHNKGKTINQRSMDQFKTASIIAIKVLSGQIEDNTNGATHFHNPTHSQPAWRSQMKKTAKIGNHDFYKM